MTANRGLRIKDSPRPLDIGDRFRRLDAPMQAPDTGWVYVDPIAPATPPADARIDYLSPSFVSPWHNVAGRAPLSFHMDDDGKVHWRGAFDGGESGTLVCTTIPEGFRPEYATTFLVAVGESAVGHLLIGADGTVTYFG